MFVCIRVDLLRITRMYACVRVCARAHISIYIVRMYADIASRPILYVLRITHTYARKRVYAYLTVYMYADIACRPILHG